MRVAIGTTAQVPLVTMLHLLKFVLLIPLAAYESVNSCKKLSLGSGSGYNSGSDDNIFWVRIPSGLSYDCEFGVPLKFYLIRFDVFTDTLHSDEKNIGMPIKYYLTNYYFVFMHKLIKKDVATKLNISLQNNIRSIFFHE